MKNLTKVFAYYRTSTSIQKEAQSWRTQKVICEEVARQKKFIIIKQFVEHKSAFKDRPLLDEILSRINEVDGIIVYNLDRLLRDPDEYRKIIEFLQLKNKRLFEAYQEIDLKDHNTEMVLRIRLAIAKHEAMQTRERTKAGIKAKKARGEPWGRPRVELSFNKIQKYLVKNADDKYQLIGQKTTISKLLGVSVCVLNRELRNNNLGYLVGEEPPQLKANRGKRGKKID